MDHPCKNCVPPKRHRACWDHCDEYIQNKKNKGGSERRSDEVTSYFQDKTAYFRKKYGWRF